MGNYRSTTRLTKPISPLEREPVEGRDDIPNCLAGVTISGDLFYGWKGDKMSNVRCVARRRSLIAMIGYNTLVRPEIAQPSNAP